MDRLSPDERRRIFVAKQPPAEHLPAIVEVLRPRLE
jgi:hypothetical protein